MITNSSWYTVGFWGNGDVGPFGLTLPCACTLRRWAVATEMSISFMFQVFKGTTQSSPLANSPNSEDGENCYGGLFSAAYAGSGPFFDVPAAAHNAGVTLTDLQNSDTGATVSFSAGDRIALKTLFLVDPTVERNNRGARITLIFEYVST